MPALTAAQRFAGQEDLVTMMLEHYLLPTPSDVYWDRRERGDVAVVFPQAYAKLRYRKIGLSTIERFGTSMRLKLYLALAREITDYTTEASVAVVKKHSFNTPFVNTLRKNSTLGTKDFPKPRYLEAFLALCPRLTRLSFSHKIPYRDGKLLQHWLFEPSILDDKMWKLTVSTLMTVASAKDITKAAWAHTTPDKAYAAFEVDIRVTLRLEGYPDKVQEWFLNPAGTPAAVRHIVASGFTLPLADLIAAAKARDDNGKSPILRIAATCPRYTLLDLAALGHAFPHLEVLELRSESAAPGAQNLHVQYFCDLADTLKDNFPNLRELRVSIARTESGEAVPAFCTAIRRHSPCSIVSKLKKVVLDGTIKPGAGTYREDPYAYALELACLGGFNCQYELPREVSLRVQAVMVYISKLGPNQQSVLFETPASSFCPESTICPELYTPDRTYHGGYMRGVRWTVSGRLLHLPVLKELKWIEKHRAALDSEWTAERNHMLGIITPARSDNIFARMPRKIPLPPPSSMTELVIYRHLVKYNDNAAQALAKLDEEEEKLLEGEKLEAGSESKVREKLLRMFKADQARLGELEDKEMAHDGSASADELGK